MTVLAAIAAFPAPSVSNKSAWPPSMKVNVSGLLSARPRCAGMITRADLQSRLEPSVKTTATAVRVGAKDLSKIVPAALRKLHREVTAMKIPTARVVSVPLEYAIRHVTRRNVEVASLASY